MIKPRYLGNHACIRDKSYDGTLSVSHGRIFIFRHEESNEAPPNGGLTITSYPVGNTTSLTGKQCMVANKLLELWSLFQNLSEVCAAFLGGGLTMTSCPVGNRRHYKAIHLFIKKTAVYKYC